MAENSKPRWSWFIGKRKLSVYISFSRRDSIRYAEGISIFLSDNGIRVFFDRQKESPEDIWIDKLQGELRHADIVIFIGSPAGLASPWVLRELEFARELLNVRILPIVFRGITDQLAIPPLLHDIMWYEEEESALTHGPTEKAKEAIFYALQSFKETERPSPPEPKRRRATEKRALNEGKLILVGRGEVGKTSLVRRLTQNDFKGDESKTQGIKITMWPLESKSATVRLNVWDFGGQEIMHATHQFFLTERSLYLLVLNGREGGEDIDAEYWLKHITTFGGDSPVIVVQNKIAQHPFDLNYRGLQASFPSIRAFIKTDCKDAVGVDSLRTAIRDAVADMPEIRMAFPANWFRVKERLETMEEDFMGYEGFRHLCHEEGIDDDRDRDTLCWLLHCLGIALNYRDDSRLRETSVLKPEWVTQGIYRILNAQKLAEVQGELHLDDLKQLLARKRYPHAKHYFILELMRKFGLCFAFPDQVDRYLIPELLGKEEPAETERFPPNDCLNFEYHYGLLPEGLLPRFIVRSHPLSRGQARWRSGVILAHEGCKALVTANASERRVVVRVAGGDAPSRRRLLAIIRYDLDRIIAEFKDRLDAREKVPLREFPDFCVDYGKLVAFEKQGVKEFPEFIGQRVVVVQVDELLNGVDLEAQRRDPFETNTNTKSVFFSYSHKDEVLRDELETHLKLLQRQGVISTWHDRKILPGSEWDREIDRDLERARIILLLVSADFMASDYCWDTEVQMAMQRHESKQAFVIPIMLRSCDWKNAPFAKLQGLPRDMKAVTLWKDRDAAWTNVASGIRTIAQEL
jgi:internalin A